MRGWIVAVGLLVTGCTPAEHKAAEAYISGQMFDPDAAKFRNVRSISKYGSINAVCGEVNGKNRLGAYVGFRTFAYYPGIKQGVIEEEDGSNTPKECQAKH